MTFLNILIRRSITSREQGSNLPIFGAEATYQVKITILP